MWMIEYGILKDEVEEMKLEKNIDGEVDVNYIFSFLGIKHRLIMQCHF